MGMVLEHVSGCDWLQDESASNTNISPRNFWAELDIAISSELFYLD